MEKLGNFILGKWIEGDGDGQILYNAINGNPIATATTQGFDFETEEKLVGKFGYLSWVHVILRYCNIANKLTQ